MGYLISNIMFYGIDPPPDDWRMRIGPIEITRTEIAIGNFLIYYCSLSIVFYIRHSQAY